ncbi:tRNA lysidine(34) synthetase TilS [Bacteroides sp. 51]|uniref:tRNA lysidine(34) synthetase TilS n=1 Tax=Bacteroides sp. 51 TaxID=2302938 RepID=UPI0013D7E6C7|nr:tRNA lysidine(34) synthetase TilS [Bacteroides sp. 51]NDV84619.1 tRNA lysidine(34) synthetase TilS [Bacteroides sp. 51]
MIKHRIAQYIEKEQLLTLQDKVLVTLSGGADSVALLRILLSLGYTCEAAHCNFHLRGEESNRDENFVEQLCHKLNVTLHVNSFETQAYACDHKISIEMAARELRYNWFGALAKEHDHTAIAVAHHQDDSVETMLLNLIRGTGINGLLGIHPKNGMIVRPLLCVTRDEIIDYLQHIGQEYVTDSTNLEDEYTRNKIRLKLIPMMQEINPSVKEKLFQTGSHLNEVATVYQYTIEEGKTRVRTEEGVSIQALLSEPSPSALLFEMLLPLGFNSPQIEDIMQSVIAGQSGKQFVSNQGWRVIRDRELLLIYKVGEKEENNTTPPFQLIYEEVEYTPNFSINKDKNIAYFDADKLKEKLTIRKWKQGDTFVPFGMTGKKLVSDFLTDRKFSLLQKENQWVLCCGEKIIWIIGERTDNRFRIENSTRRVMIVKLQ